MPTDTDVTVAADRSGVMPSDVWRRCEMSA